MTDVIVIGGGLNGLVTAYCLAKKKFSVLLLERHDQVGGGAHLSHALGPISADVLRALNLDRAGLPFITPDPALTTIGPDGSHVTFHRDHVLTAASIGRVSAHDAGRWQPFVTTVQRLGGVLAEINRHPAPSVDEPGSSDVWNLLQVGRKARALGRRDLARLTRYVPMAVADLTGEWFEHDLVQAAVAARGVFGHAVGPWSAGTGALLLQRIAEDPLPVGSGISFPGGPAAFTALLADHVRAAGVDIRVNASVAQIRTVPHAAGVVLESGEELPSHAVVAAVAPSYVFASLIEPGALPPTFRRRVRNIRARGVTARISLGLSGLPDFPALDGDPHALHGRVLIAPSVDYLERAHDAGKYGDVSPSPWLDVRVASVSDPSLVADGEHLLSMYVHQVPSGSADDDVAKKALQVLEQYAPGVSRMVTRQHVVTADTLREEWSYPGGHIFHGEGAIDQWWISRPLLGWADRYATPVPGLFLASAGTHPGGGLTGQSGLNAARAISVALGRRRR